jgi:hypothetical protein
MTGIYPETSAVAAAFDIPDSYGDAPWVHGAEWAWVEVHGTIWALHELATARQVLELPAMCVVTHYYNLALKISAVLPDGTRDMLPGFVHGYRDTLLRLVNSAPARMKELNNWLAWKATELDEMEDAR